MQVALATLLCPVTKPIKVQHRSKSLLWPPDRCPTNIGYKRHEPLHQYHIAALHPAYHVAASTSSSPQNNWRQSVAAHAAAALMSLGLLLVPSSHAEQLSQSAAPDNVAKAAAAVAGGITTERPDDTLQIRFPASRNPAIRAAQQEMVQSWAYTDQLFLDLPLSRGEWKSMLEDSLAASFSSTDPGEVHELTDKLLKGLKDPFTRILRDGDAEAFSAETQGKVVSSGVAVEQDKISVLATIVFVANDSPAAAAGLTPGDKILTINRKATAHQDLNEINASLRKPSHLLVISTARTSPGQQQGMAWERSRVSSQLLSLAGAASEQQPRQQLATPVKAETGAPAANQVQPSPASLSQVLAGSTSLLPSMGSNSLNSPTIRAVHLEPAPVSFSPVQYAVLTSPAAEAEPTQGTLSMPAAPMEAIGDTGFAAQGVVQQQPVQKLAGEVLGQGALHKTGYIRIVLWSKNVGEEVQKAVNELLQQDQIDSLVLDLRDNPGGLVSAGLDVANILMNKGDVFCIVYDRSGQEEEVRLTEEIGGDGAALKLGVLVNSGSASTSELLAGALHDSRGALLVGEKSFGKGRTQRVIQLTGGRSTLLVSDTGYLTPGRYRVDKRGLDPDVACVSERAGSMVWTGGRDTDDGSPSLMSDPCIRLVYDKLSAL